MKKNIIYIIALVFFVMIFYCTPTEEEISLTETLKGVWIESSSTEDTKITFTDDYVTRETYDESTSQYEINMAGYYVYTEENDEIQIDIEKMQNPQDETEIIEIPYTYYSGIIPIMTIKEAQLTTNIIMDVDKNPVIAALSPYTGGGTTDLQGTWSSSNIMTMIVQPTGGEDQPTAINYNTTIIFNDTKITYQYYDIDYNILTGEFTMTQVIETANVTYTTIGTFQVTGGESNEELINGIYKYKIINSYAIFSFPENQGDTAETPTYLIKQK